MKKVISVLCASLIFLQSMTAIGEESSSSLTKAAASSGNLSNTAAKTSQQANEQRQAIEAMQTAGGEPTPVTYQADEDADYSEGAGNNAALADMAIDVTMTVVSHFLGELLQQLKQYLTQYQCEWGPVSITWNVISLFSSLAHAAVNYFMRDTWYITASFTGAQGHVTDKWIGKGHKKVEVAVLKEFEVPAQRFAAIAFDVNEYKNLKNVDSASARELMEYRNKTLIEEQRSLDNVTDETWGIRYRAQRRSITALAAALKMKETLAALAEADGRISANYDSKTDAVATVAARRVLYDALMFLKMNVMAARTKLRAEAMELDFEPVTTDPEGTEQETK